jgi:hypothetical protein
MKESATEAPANWFNTKLCGVVTVRLSESLAKNVISGQTLVEN